MSWPTTNLPTNVYLPALRMVQSIQLPSQAGGLTYTFNYGPAGTVPVPPNPLFFCTSSDYITTVSPELRSVTIPSGAVAAYSYAVDSSTANPPLFNAFLNNTIHT